MGRVRHPNLILGVDREGKHRTQSLILILLIAKRQQEFPLGIEFLNPGIFFIDNIKASLTVRLNIDRVFEKTGRISPIGKNGILLE
jgi:hypothetical protein